MKPADGKLIDILPVEDDAADVRLTREALKGATVKIRLHVVKDGVEALAFLRHDGRYRDAATPGLVLLDLNLPRMNGRQALGEIKGDPAPKHIPVVMFTGSKAEADIATAFELQANGYVIKPVELDQFLKAVRSMEGFLVGIVDTPPATEHDAT